MANTPGTIRLEVTGMPELIANLRRQMAAVLLEHAAEAGADGRRDLEEELVRIAAEYEVGR